MALKHVFTTGLAPPISSKLIKIYSPLRTDHWLYFNVHCKQKSLYIHTFSKNRQSEKTSSFTHCNHILQLLFSESFKMKMSQNYIRKSLTFQKMPNSFLLQCKSNIVTDCQVVIERMPVLYWCSFSLLKEAFGKSWN
jgi:hypothetical protein